MKRLIDISNQCANLVYEALGPGHSESVYHRAMEVEFRARGIRFESKVILPIEYRGLCVGHGEADLIIYSDEDPMLCLIVELKAVTYAPRASERGQIGCYMRIKKQNVGLLINFRQPTASVACPDKVDFSVVSFETPLQAEQAEQAQQELCTSNKGIEVTSLFPKEDPEPNDDK